MAMRWMRELVEPDKAMSVTTAFLCASLLLLTTDTDNCFYNG
jgi:hypothetical protein